MISTLAAPLQSVLAWPWPVLTHVAAALAAVLLAAVQFYRPKGDDPHRRAGWIWVGLMGWVALSGLMIHEGQMLGPFSPIHLLSLLVLRGLWRSVRFARRGEIERHARIMRRMMIWGLLLAAALALMPGRRLHTLLFAGKEGLTSFG